MLATHFDSRTPRLIESDPAFDTVSKSFIAKTSIVLEVFQGLFDIQPPAVSIVKLLRKIPVIQCDPRFDASGDEAVDEFIVEDDASFVDRIISSAPGDDT